VRAQGVPSQACPELDVDEYHLINSFAKRSTDFPLLVRFTCMTTFRLHLIARIDDVANVFSDEIRIHPQFGFALVVQLRWTKNCLD
jgi:hypothetical protein